MTKKQFSGEVLREFRKRHRLTQVKLAALLEIDRTYLARIETGDRAPSEWLQREIKEILARFESEWLLACRMAGRPPFSVHNLPARLRSRNIPVVSWAAAGKANDYQDLESQIDETVGTHVTDPNAFAVIIEGDSMEPELKAGDRVVLAPKSGTAQRRYRLGEVEGWVRDGEAVSAHRIERRDDSVAVREPELCGVGISSEPGAVCLSGDGI